MLEKEKGNKGDMGKRKEKNKKKINKRMQGNLESKKKSFIKI